MQGNILDELGLFAEADIWDRQVTAYIGYNLTKKKKKKPDQIPMVLTKLDNIQETLNMPDDSQDEKETILPVQPTAINSTMEPKNDSKKT